MLAFFWAFCKHIKQTPILSYLYLDQAYMIIISIHMLYLQDERPLFGVVDHPGF